MAGAAFAGAVAGGMIGGIMNSAQNYETYWYNKELAEQARAENFKYNEMAADNADKRQRAQFADLYSIPAQMQQLKDAGLSPSLMYGGTPSPGGMATGQQGGGANGIPAPTYMPNSNVMAAASLANSVASANLMQAQAKEANAKANNLDKDSTIKELEANLKQMSNAVYESENAIFTAVNWTNEDGTPTSLFDMAEDSKDFAQFKDKVWNASERGGVDEKWYRNEKTTEQLRQYFENTRKFGTNLTTLQNIEATNKFNTSLTNALNTPEFIKLSTNDAIQKLKASVETNDLTTQQKGAWNRLLNKMEDGTTKDILIVGAMILNNALSNYHMPNMQNKTFNTNNYIQ